jgi:hypothetical protein
MGLFSRGSKSDVPLNGDEWSSNGDSRRRDRVAPSSEKERREEPLAEREEQAVEAPEPTMDQPVSVNGAQADEPTDAEAPSEDATPDAPTEGKEPEAKADVATPEAPSEAPATE